MPRSTNTRAVTAAVIMATFLAALDTTVVGTAMPTIIGSLGGLALYSWVFSAYLLTSTTTVPIYGRMADVYGRKPVFFAGATLFLTGSILCGLSGSMEMLILFRAIQGLGAGAVLPVSITVVGDIFPVHERARVQGLISAVWAVSALVGPAAGGLIVDHFDWRWVFYVNIPFGAVSIALFWFFLHEAVPTKRRSMDYLGTCLLAASITLLLVGLMNGVPQPPGVDFLRWVALAASAGLLGLFIWQESRIDEPVLPLSLFKNRVISTASLVGLLGGAILFGVSSYIPPFVQGVQGGSATSAGIALATVSLGWPVAATGSARLILRWGYRPVVLVGTGLITVGSVLLTTVQMDTPQLLLLLAMLLIGLGMGFSATPLLVAVQSAVGWQQRGVATASNQFFRSIGGAIGVAVMGTIVNSRMQVEMGAVQLSEMAGTGQGIPGASVILDPVAREQLPAGVLLALRSAFDSSLHAVYIAVALAAVAGMLLSLLFPRGSVDDHAHKEEAAVANGERPEKQSHQA